MAKTISFLSFGHSVTMGSTKVKPFLLNNQSNTKKSLYGYCGAPGILFRCFELAQLAKRKV